jgi:hypothetical protein
LSGCGATLIDVLLAAVVIGLVMLTFMRDDYPEGLWWSDYYHRED